MLADMIVLCLENLKADADREVIEGIEWTKYGQTTRYCEGSSSDIERSPAV